jgi:hypothetical protein
MSNIGLSVSGTWLVMEKPTLVIIIFTVSWFGLGVDIFGRMRVWAVFTLRIMRIIRFWLN